MPSRGVKGLLETEPPPKEKKTPAKCLSRYTGKKADKSKLMQALDEARKQQHITQEQLAALTGKKREAISRLFSSDGANPTLETIIEFLSALNLTADITLRPTRVGEEPIKVVLASPGTYRTSREE